MDWQAIYKSKLVSVEEAAGKIKSGDTIWFSPGNVRELENTLESAIALSSGPVLEEADLPLRVRTQISAAAARKAKGMLAMQELEAIKQALAKYNGHREKTARELGISRRALQYKLNKFQLQIEKRSDGAGLRGGL